MTRIIRCLLAVVSLVVIALAQNNTTETASVAGRVLRGDKPAVGALVLAHRARQPSGWEATGLSARTDSSGQYQLTGLAPGNYLIAVATVAEIVKIDGQASRSGKTVVLQAGEAVTSIDFSLVNGGVITGTISDENGKPAVNEEITLLNYYGTRKSLPYFGGSFNYMNRTDDRGVYRLFGLPPGKYVLRIGNDNASPSNVSKSYPLTFYPGVAEEAKAKIIEVTEGGEATGIDIKLPKPEALYVARGRVIDATTGKPLVGVRLGYNALLTTGEDRYGPGHLTREATNAQGEFQLHGLRASNYLAYLRLEEGSDYYALPARFTITDSDVSGLELKAERGGSISGVVVIEGTKDPKLLASAATFQLGVMSNLEEGQTYRSNWPRISPNGNFRLTGLAPGNIRFTMGYGGLGGPLPRQLPMLLRTEKDGVELPQGVPLKAGEHLTGVRVVFGYGTGVVRGQVNLMGGALPTGAQLRFFLKKIKPADGWTAFPGTVDANGRFLIEGLFAGEYQLTFDAPGATRFSPAVRQRIATPQPVIVTADEETSINITLDLREEGKQ